MDVESGSGMSSLSSSDDSMHSASSGSMTSTMHSASSGSTTDDEFVEDP